MASFQLTKLINRKLIKISGPDSYPYLQGLLCNDLRYLYEPQRIAKRRHANVSPNVLSAFMLNAQGRAICDILLYRTPHTRFECKFTAPGEAKEPDELLIECDSNAASGLSNTLYGYRVRRKVSLEIQSDLDVWCLYPKLDLSKSKELDDNRLQELLDNSKSEVLENNLTIVNDPRLVLMGIRIISDSYYNFSQISRELQLRLNIDADIEEASVTKYILHRYKLGVGEGVKDHPEGNCHPLESNADLLGSVSFDKGCYLGQELIARIHFTGVVRKRLMPIRVNISDGLDPAACVLILPGSDIVDAKDGKKLGTIRNIFKGYGLGLLRHSMITETTQLMHAVSRAPITTWKPYWWNLQEQNSQ